MKNIIRNGMFETNSSSTHVCILATSDVIEAWKNGDLAYIEYMSNDHMRDLPEDAFIEDNFLKKEYFDKVNIRINLDINVNITLKNMIDLWNGITTAEDLWGTDASLIVKEIKSCNYYDDYEEDNTKLSKEDILSYIGCEAVEVYPYDMFFERYSEIEYNHIAKCLNGINVEVLSWDGYEG